MIKGIYTVELTKGLIKGSRKKYHVFYGDKLIFFDSLSECRSFIRVHSSKLEKLYYRSKELFNILSEKYIDFLVGFRVSESNSRRVGDLLKCIIEHYGYIARSYYKQHLFSKLRAIYSCLLDISRLLNSVLLSKSISFELDNFFYFPDIKQVNQKIKVSKTVNYGKLQA